MKTKQAFMDKNARVLLCVESAAIKNVFMEVLRNLEYKLITPVSSFRDAMHIFEADGESLDWLIMPLCANQKINSFHLLDIFLRNDEFNHLHTSLILEPDEHYAIPHAFDLGAFSWHPVPRSKEDLEEEMQTLHLNLEKYDYSPILTSAEYVRKHWHHERRIKELVEFERNIADLFPENPHVHVSLGEAYFLDSKPREALGSLAKARLLSQKLKPDIDMVIEAYVDSPEELDPAEYSPARTLGLKKCLIVDQDGDNQQLLWSILLAMGIPKVRICEDGEQAWQIIEKGFRPDLIIQEWHLAKISASRLVQRFRQVDDLNAPIIIMSNRVTKDDVPLLREMGINSIIRKPISKDELAGSIVSGIREDRFPSSVRMQVRKILEYINQGSIDHAKILAERCKQRPDATAADKLCIDAEIAFAEECYQECHDIAISGIKKNYSTLTLMNLLGKCFMKLGDYASARRCFERTQEFSPHNILRLCDIAYASSLLGEYDQARTTLQSAESLDPGNPGVVETHVKIALIEGDLGKARKLMESMTNLSGIVSYMNNEGVTLSKSGRLKSAVDMFEKAIETLPEDRNRERCILLYNLGLTLAKAEKYKRAYHTLKRVDQEEETTVHRKAASLRERIKLTVTKGVPLTLHQSDAGGSGLEHKTGIPDTKTLERAVRRPLGTRCCHELIQLSEADRARTNGLLSNPPKYTKREAIKRGRSMGLEKLWKASS